MYFPELFGNLGGSSKGKGDPMHMFRKEANFLVVMELWEPKFL